MASYERVSLSELTHRVEVQAARIYGVEICVGFDGRKHLQRQTHRKLNFWVATGLGAVSIRNPVAGNHRHIRDGRAIPGFDRVIG